MNKVWKLTLDKIYKELSDQNYNTWIKPIKLNKIEENIIKLYVPNKFIKNWVEENYKKKLENIATEVGYLNYEIYIEISEEVISKSINNDQVSEQKGKENKQNYVKSSNLNINYTFETFISGSSN